MKSKTYSNLSDETKKRYQYIFDKVIKEGISIDNVLKMDKKTFNSTFKTKIKKNSSLEGRKRLIRQVLNRKDNVLKDYIKTNQIKNKTYVNFLKKETHRLFKPKSKIGTIDFPSTDLKKGAYSVVKVTDFLTNKEFFIKFNNKESLENQFETLKKTYNINSYNSEYLGTHYYQEFIDKQFKQKLEKNGIKI
ncbi:MAG: hypothetical protein P8Y70_01510 [Candidatus Lokiarchaeota archaeon]